MSAENPTASVLPSEQDLEMPRESDQTFDFCFFDPTLADPDNPLDLSTATVTWTFKDKKTGAVVFTYINVPGEHEDDPAGRSFLELVVADTSGTSADYTTVWEYCAVVSDGGQERPYVKGCLKIVPC